jgi:aspartic proteinase inhibitor
LISSQIKQLDRKQREIDSPLNYTLSKCGTSIPGGFTVISPSDSEVLSAANVAVDEQQRREGKSIKLMSVGRADKQTVAGQNYKMCLQTNVDGTVKWATAVVYRNLKMERSLTSWSWGRCSDFDLGTDRRD